MPTLEELESQVADLINQVTDLGARLGGLEQNPAPQQSVSPSSNDWIWLPEPAECINRSVTSTDSDWVNSKSETYVPKTAKEVKVFSWVDGTSNGTGLNSVLVLGGGVEQYILVANEEGSGSAPAPCCQCDVPVTEGRFDHKATHNGGSGSFSFVVQIVAYKE